MQGALIIVRWRECSGETFVAVFTLRSRETGRVEILSRRPSKESMMHMYPPEKVEAYWGASSNICRLYYGNASLVLDVG